MAASIDIVAAKLTAARLGPKLTSAQIDALYLAHPDDPAIRQLYLNRACDEIIAAHQMNV